MEEQSNLKKQSILPQSSLLTNNNNNNQTTTESRLSDVLISGGVKDFAFKHVLTDYYDWSLEDRQDVLGAASIHHLCKSIVLSGAGLAGIGA
ncbi:hypothetical protein Tco_0855263 [Tanacetum coccineum]